MISLIIIIDEPKPEGQFCALKRDNCGKMWICNDDDKINDVGKCRKKVPLLNQIF